jgi:hypothetical protein
MQDALPLREAHAHAHEMFKNEGVAPDAEQPVAACLNGATAPLADAASDAGDLRRLIISIPERITWLGHPVAERD